MTSRVALNRCDDTPPSSTPARLAPWCALGARARAALRSSLALAALLAFAACSAPPECPPNRTTVAEVSLGWELIFDGETLEGWELFGKPGDTSGWTVSDGAITRTGGGGDLVTVDDYEDFELRLQWRIEERGNSGIFYRVATDTDAVWRTGPEMQVLDNERHPDGESPYTSAGANYALYAPKFGDATRPIGEWNDVHILVRGDHVEQWLNGVLQCSYTLQSEEWEARVAASKFASMPRYGREPRGRIALQDHGDPVWFRSVKIREID